MQLFPSFYDARQCLRILDDRSVSLCAKDGDLRGTARVAAAECFDTLVAQVAERFGELRVLRVEDVLVSVTGLVACFDHVRGLHDTVASHQLPSVEHAVAGILVVADPYLPYLHVLTAVEHAPGVALPHLEAAALDLASHVDKVREGVADISRV